MEYALLFIILHIADIAGGLVGLNAVAGVEVKKKTEWEGARRKGDGENEFSRFPLTGPKFLFCHDWRSFRHINAGFGERSSFPGQRLSKTGPHTMATKQLL